MKDSDIRQLNRGRRVQQFNSTFSPPFVEGSRGAEMIAAHNAAVAEVVEQAGRQDAATLDRQESTEQKDAAIKSLSQLLKAVNQTARSMNKPFPGIADQFKMPRNSDQSVLNRAHAFIAAATPMAAEFTSRGLPESFLDDLQAAINNVVAAEDRQAAALANQTAATAALRLALKQEQETMSQLNAIMRNVLRNNPAALAAWESASRIESAPKKKQQPPPSSPTQ